MSLEYLPSSDSKQTVEKAVRPKPSWKDLVKVESPGKPMPASNLVEKPPHTAKKRTRKKATSSNIKINQPKRDSILIITEKPQAANKIANALSPSASKFTENRVSYYELQKEGKNIIVCSAVGHLLNLTYAPGQKGWPVFETIWVPSHTQKSASFTRNYYNLIKKLAKRANELIIATDFDVEGEVIGWNVVRFIVGKDKAKRMKYSTLTAPELQKSYAQALPEIAWGQAYAGETRHLVDWLYGINLSRALMSAIKTSGTFKILSIGRVQGPALKIIVDRDREIRNFTSKPFWQVLALSQGIEFKHPKDLFDKTELEIFKDITEAEAETKKSEQSLAPPPPFDLTTLQREVHAHHRISPSQTLKLAQSLYLDGIISYPRTSSQKIPKEINPLDILKKLERRFPEAKIATRSTPVEGKKFDPAHPSIYPTGESPNKSLTSEEEKIYNLIARRFISCFSPNAKTANKRITLTSQTTKGEKTFTASGLVVLEKGWTAVYPTKLDEKSLPDINGHVKIDKINFLEKETQPPKRYTSASLVSIMEKKNLGTKATRSMIVDTLFNRGYLDGKSIQATPLGERLIEALEKYSPIIIDENLTRDLEEKMEEILHSSSKTPESLKEKEEKILEQVKKLITDISKEFRTHEHEIGKKLSHGTEELREQQKESNIIMQCPVCKSGNLTIKYSKKTKKQFVACDAYPECKSTYPLPPGGLIKKTEKLSNEGLPILISYKKGKRPWEFTFNPFWREQQKDKEEN